MELPLIKNKIKKNKNILKITTSLKAMSMSRLKNLKKNKDNLIKYCNDIKTHILTDKEEVHNMEYIYESYEDEMEIKEEIIYIHIFLFTDMSFCGTLNKQNENYIKKIPNNREDNNNYYLIVGFKGEKYKNIPNGIDYVCKIYDKKLNKHIHKKIASIIADRDFNKVIVNLYSYEEKPIEIIYKDNSIKEGDLSYRDFYSRYLLNSNMVNYKYEECKKRLMKVTTAINNSKELDLNLSILYNKKRQEMITKDLLEVISGSQVDMIG